MTRTVLFLIAFSMLIGLDLGAISYGWMPTAWDIAAAVLAFVFVVYEALWLMRRR